MSNIVPSAVPQVVVLDGIGTDDGLKPTGSAARWEMMVPKMTRPPTKRVASLSAASAPELAVSVPKASPSVPAPANSSAVPPVAMTPVAATPVAPAGPTQFSATFSLHTPEDQFVARYWPQIVYLAIGIVAISCLIWGLSAPAPAAHSASSSPVVPSTWSHQPLSPSGRSLAVYEPSRTESDYRMEFSWVPNSGGIGWVFRTRDASNYYAAHLGLEQHATGAVLIAEHFSVLAGTESPHARKVIPVPVNAGLLRVHMDAIGPGFKVFLENNPVDSWTDARLNSGALGFYDDGHHSPKLLALSITFIENAVSRTSVVPLP